MTDVGPKKRTRARFSIVTDVAITSTGWKDHEAGEVPARQIRGALASMSRR